MRQSQAEIKAIKAQLHTIRAEPSAVQPVPSTVLEQSSPHSRPRNPTPRPPASQTAQTRSGQNSPAQNSVQNPPDLNRRPTAYPSQSTPTGKRVEGYPLSPRHRLPNHLAATVDRLQEQSAYYVQQFNRVQSQSFQTPEHLLEQTLEILESQVEHINQLSAVQESAILDLKTIAEQVEREWKTIERNQGLSPQAEDNPPICEYLGVAVPQIEQTQDGIYVLSARSIDLFKAEREATLTAEALRHWSNRKHPTESQAVSPSFWQRLSRLLSPASSDRAAAARNAQAATQAATAPGQRVPASRRVSRRQQAASRSILRIKEAVALFLGAVVVRAVLDMVLVSFPMLWTPAIALLVTPAAIAVYRSSHTPQSGLVWGYRLLIIMIGLLLGGRL